MTVSSNACVKGAEGPYCTTAVFNSFINLKSKVWYCLTLVSCWSITSTTGKASTSDVSCHLPQAWLTALPRGAWYISEELLLPVSDILFSSQSSLVNFCSLTSNSNLLSCVSLWVASPTVEVGDLKGSQSSSDYLAAPLSEWCALSNISSSSESLYLSNLELRGPFSEKTLSERLSSIKLCQGTI